MLILIILLFILGPAVGSLFLEAQENKIYREQFKQESSNANQ